MSALTEFVQITRTIACSSDPEGVSFRTGLRLIHKALQSGVLYPEHEREEAREFLYAYAGLVPAALAEGKEVIDALKQNNGT